MTAKKITVSKIFLDHAKRFRFSALAIIVLCVLLNLCDAVIPWMYKLFFDALATGQRQELATKLVGLLAIIALFMAGRIVFRYASDRISSSMMPKIMNDLIETSYRYLIRHSYQFFANNFSGSLVRKIQRLAFAFDSVGDIIQYNIIALVVSLVGATILLSLRNGVLALIIVAWTVIVVAANFFFSKRIMKYRKERAVVDSETTGALSDSISNALNIKQFSGYKFEQGLLARVLKKLQLIRTLTWYKQVNAQTAQVIFLAIVEVGLMYYAIGLYAKGMLTLGDFALIQGIVMQLWSVMWGLVHIFRNFSEALADAQEMIDILNKPYDIKDAAAAEPLRVGQGLIEFKNVVFNYRQTRRVLDKFSLRIEPKEKVALVGPSGAGKSTIVKLLLRYYDIDDGKILIDGQNIISVTQDSLRDAIAMVPQEPLLFHRSLADNIRYGRRDATDKEVYEAAQKARCHEFIGALPDGYKTFVGERGIKLSGGERQRVAIARAILKDSSILVLDEATSSLDSESESLIHEALHELMKAKTVIVIAHRLSTIMEMDRIVVVENGRVVDIGTHDELLARVGTYKKLWEIQAGGFMV